MLLQGCANSPNSSTQCSVINNTSNLSWSQRTQYKNINCFDQHNPNPYDSINLASALNEKNPNGEELSGANQTAIDNALVFLVFSQVDAFGVVGTSATPITLTVKNITQDTFER